MDLSEEHKKEVERRIMEKIISSLENNDITEEDYNNISEFILARIDNVKSHHDLLVFLRELSEKWNIFAFVLTLENGEVKDVKEHIAAKKAEELAESGNIEEAIQTAKDAIVNQDNNI